jgi:paraquat-inducible protein A
VTVRATCRDCGAVQALGPDPHQRGAVCFRCGAVLAVRERAGLRRAAPVLIVAAIPLLIAANLLPIMLVDGPHGPVQASVFAAVATLHGQQLDALAVLVLLLVAVLPAVLLGALTYLLWRPAAPAACAARAVVAAFGPWSQIEVLLLAMVIVLHRLSQLFHVVPGAALPCMAAFVVLVHLVGTSLPTAAKPPAGDHDARAPDAGSLARTTAFLLAAAALLIPAYLLPITTTTTLLGARSDTLASGVVELWRAGSVATATLLAVASMVVPGVKIVALGLLVMSSRLRAIWWRAGRTRLHRLIHVVGRWSMLDVFVMALVATVLRTRVAGVTLERGALAFAAVVVLTMFASASFDPRLIWRPGARA